MPSLIKRFRKSSRRVPGGVLEPPAVRNRAYDEFWADHMRLIAAAINDGGGWLPTVLAAVFRRIEEGMAMEPTSYLCYDTPVMLPQRGARRMFRSLVVEAVNELCSAATQSVVELGSGAGDHLCNIWCEGGPRHATYYACELSGAGRRCAEMLASLDDAFPLKTAFFDYLDPDFPSLPRDQAELVVYSVHSVEQVEELPPELLPRLCALADRVSGMHLEPVGWQILGNRRMNAWTERHRQRCADKKYNRNLWPLLRAAERSGLISIECAVPNFFGLESNPASYIVWRKRSSV